KTRVKTIARRTGLVRQVSEHLGEAQILHLDLGAGSEDLQKLGLKELGATEEEQRLVTSTVQSYQRAWALANNLDDTHPLVRKGFTSALSIGTQPLAAFQAAAGLDAARAKTIWDKARRSLADVTLAASAIVDVQNGLFDNLNVGNLPPSVTEHL